MSDCMSIVFAIVNASVRCSLLPIAQRFRPPRPNTCRFSLWFSQQVVILQAAKGRMVKAKRRFSKLGN